MPGDRRDFLGSLLAVSLAGKVEGTSPNPQSPLPIPQAMSWLSKIRGTHRAVFDNPRDDGTGLIRAWIWLNQCQSVMGAAGDDCTAVVVLRHGAVTLAMNDAFWAQDELAMSGSTPEKPNIPKRNPQMAAAMVDSMGMFPPPARALAQGLGLDALIARGGIVVACEFAFWGITQRVLNRDKSTEAEARERALAHLVPGVSLVPSGFLALAAAQQQGCSFVTNA
jgi:hypothetical protein